VKNLFYFISIKISTNVLRMRLTVDLVDVEIYKEVTNASAMKDIKLLMMEVTANVRKLIMANRCYTVLHLKNYEPHRI